MSYYNGPKIVSGDSITMTFDAANPKSYPGSGTTWYDLVSRSSNVVSNLNSFDSGISLNTRSSTFAAIPFTFSNNITFDVWYRTYTTASGISTQFESPGIMQLGNYAANTSFTLWDWSANTPGIHTIYTYINNSAVWTAVTNARTYTDAEWLRYHNICMVFSGAASGWTQYRLYIDTVLYTIYNIPNAVDSTKLAGGNFLYFPGANGGAINNSYSIVRSYNRALSDIEILQNYNATKGRFGL